MHKCPRKHVKKIREKETAHCTFIDELARFQQGTEERQKRNSNFVTDGHKKCVDVA